MKTEKEMLAFIDRYITQQGNEGAITITPLLVAMVEKLFAEATTGVSPIVVNIATRGKKVGSRTTYDVTTNQSIVNGFIDYAFDEQEKTRLFVEDGAALIGFTYLEIDELSITGRVETQDGEYGLFLSKNPGDSHFYHEEVITAIPEVTNGEIKAYNDIFGATYDKIENKFMLRVGATEFRLTPSEMMIVNEEYNKTSTDGNYTAMWANSVSKLIRVAPWFFGFPAFKLHSAFFNSKKVIVIDLHTENINVADLTGAFSGCERLEQISGVMTLRQGAPVTDAFKGCKTLRVFKLHGLASNIDLSDCPMLAYEVFEDLIINSAMTRITIYVHSDVKNNINNNPLWADVKNALDRKVNVTIQTK